MDAASRQWRHPVRHDRLAPWACPGSFCGVDRGPPERTTGPGRRVARERRWRASLGSAARRSWRREVAPGARALSGGSTRTPRRPVGQLPQARRVVGSVGADHGSPGRLADDPVRTGSGGDVVGNLRPARASARRVARGGGGGCGGPPSGGGRSSSSNLCRSADGARCRRSSMGGPDLSRRTRLRHWWVPDEMSSSSRRPGTRWASSTSSADELADLTTLPVRVRDPGPRSDAVRDHRAGDAGPWPRAGGWFRPTGARRLGGESLLH